MSSAQQQWLDQVGSVLETQNQGVIINDDTRRVVFANSMFCEMIKLRAEDLLGRRIADLYPPEDVPQLLEFIGRRETEGRARYEFYLPQSDGGRLPVAVTSRQVQAAGGHAFGIVTATDISELKRTESELRHANSLLLERQRQVEQELRLAERVQQSLAPAALTWGGVAVETYYQPVWSVGGDYGLVTPGKNHLDALVCDVSGHGISSALFAGRVYSETMAQIERGAGLEAMLRHLNHFIVQNLASSGFYLTAGAVRIGHGARSLQFAGAGHPPAMILRSGQSVRLLESNSLPLGLFEDAVGQNTTIDIPLQSGDRVLLYTDGLTENFSPRGEMLGVEGLGEIARDAAHMPLDQMKQRILERSSDWRGGPPADDMSLVLIEIP